MLEIKLSDIEISEEFDSVGEEILLKLKFLSEDYASAKIGMGDYTKFCFTGSPKVDFQAPTDKDIIHAGLYGKVNGMKIYVGKGSKEGFALVELKIMN
jgi:hypothetical protein